MCYNTHMPTTKSELLRFFSSDALLKRNRVIIGGMGLLVLAGLVVVLSFWQTVAVAAALIFLVLSFTRPRWVLGFLVIWIPLEPFLLKFVPDEVYVYARYFSEGLIYFLGIMVLVRIIMGQKRLRHTPLDLPTLLFIVVLIGSALLNTVEASVAMLGIRQILRFVILFFVVSFLYPPRAFIRKLVVALLVLVVFEGLLGIAQAFIGGPLDTFLIPSERRFFESIQLTTGVRQFWDPGSRVFATLGRYDQLGTFLSFFLLLVVGLGYQRGLGRTRRALWAVLAIGVPALLLTYSRASWFGFVLGLLLIGIWFMRDRRVFTGFLIFLAMIGGYLAYSGIAVRTLTEEGGRQTVAERFLEAFSYERWRGEYFGLGRLYWIVETPKTVIRAAPLFGVGPGQYGGGAVAALGNARAYDALGLPFGVYGSEGYIDNNWFALWGESGTIGLGLYLWMYVMLAFIAVRVFRDSSDAFTRGLALGYLGALVAVAFAAFLGTYLEVRTLALYVWLFGGMLFVLGRREKII
jgi:hypothetical protein